MQIFSNNGHPVLKLLIALSIITGVTSCKKVSNSLSQAVEDTLNLPQSDVDPTSAEATIVNQKIAQYFYFPKPSTENAYTKLNSSYKPSIKIFHYQNIGYKNLEMRLNESDSKNGITRRIQYSLTASQPCRIKDHNKPWSKWQQGGDSRIGSSFNFTLITTEGKVSIERESPFLQSYVKPSQSEVR